jgi:hypothetical protein
MFVVVTRAEPISNVPPKLRCERGKKEKNEHAMQCSADMSKARWKKDSENSV